jgi:prevent-host-death family protein
MEVGVRTAKTELSRLIKAALSGEKVFITDRGKPLVRLVPESPKQVDRRRATVHSKEF